MAEMVEMNEAEAEELYKILAFAKDGNFTAVFATLDQLRALHRLVNITPAPAKFKGFALLHWAAFHGNLDAIYRLIMEFRAKPELKTSPGGQQGDLDAQEVALKQGHDVAFQYMCSLSATSPTEGGLSLPEPPAAGAAPKPKKSRLSDVKGPVKQIKKERYKKELLQIAEESEGISRSVAEKLWRCAKESAGKVTEMECKTLKFILEGMPVDGVQHCTVDKDAEDYLREQLETEIHAEVLKEDAEHDVQVGAVEPVEKGACEIKLSGPAVETPPKKAAGKASPSKPSPKKAARTASPLKKAEAKKSLVPALNKGDEIKIVTKNADGRKEVQFCRVFSLRDGTLNVGELLSALDRHSRVYKADLRPLNWAKTLGGMTKAFRDFVVNFDSTKQPSCEQLLQQKWKPGTGNYTQIFPKGDGKLPTEPKARQSCVIYSYTADKPNVYSHVTLPLRSNTRVEMEQWGGYIRELQECFRSGQEDGLLEPYKGKVWRFETLDKRDLDLLHGRFQKGEEVTYASFTSTSAKDPKVMATFAEGRNVLYEINCYANGLHTGSSYYFPADINDFSKFKGLEAEVLFPSQCKFRIVNMSHDQKEQRLIVYMETTEWPSVWDLIEEKKWKELKTYAENNQDVMKTKNAKHSVLGAVAKVCKENPEEDCSEAIGICVANGADVDEVDPETEAPVVEAIVEAVEAIKKTGKPTPKGLDQAIQKFAQFDAAKMPKAYYKQEHGEKYIRSLLYIAESRKNIGKDAARVLVEWASKGKGLTANKRNSLERILTGELPAHRKGDDPIKVRIGAQGRAILTDFLKHGPKQASPSPCPRG